MVFYMQISELFCTFIVIIKISFVIEMQTKFVELWTAYVTKKYNVVDANTKHVEL